MIFTQEASLTRKWFSGRSCIQLNWNKLGVNFEEGGNWSARRKPSKSGWDRLKLNPHTTFVVEVEGVIDIHYASLTSHLGVQHRIFLSRWSPIQISTPSNRAYLRWTNGNRFFPFGDGRTAIILALYPIIMFHSPPTMHHKFHWKLNPICIRCVLYNSTLWM